jgi:hypothetical protein
MVDHDPVQLRRIQRPWLVATVGVVLLLAIVASFALGRFVQAPTRNAIEAAQKPIRVLASVENRVVDSRQSFAGTIKAGKTTSVTVTPAVDPAVVTRQNLKPGDALTGGALLGVVSGEPYFAMPGPLPLYRDLGTGATGDDVRALQTSLLAIGSKVRGSGRIDSATLAAVRALFVSQGFTMPAGSPIPFREFLPVVTTGAKVVSVAPVGATLDAKTPLVVVRASANYATFRADAIETQKISVGAKLSVQAGTQVFDATIQSIGSFTNGTGTQLPGRDVDLTAPDPAFTALTDGTAVSILGSGSTARSLAIPLTAVRQDNAGDYVERRTGTSGKYRYVRIRISVLRNGGGWAAIASKDLSAGDQIAVS